MSETIVAKRYARALFELAQEKDQVEKLAQELEGVASLIQQVPELNSWLRHRGIPPDEKKAVLRRLLADRVGQLTLNFLLLLCDRKREAYLGAICQQFRILAQEAAGLVEGEVRSAFSLEPEQVRALEERFSQITGRKVRLEARVDPELIGGLVVRIGDRVWDGSLAQRLRSLKAHLTGLSLEQLRGDKAG
ncbi:MAG: ATP synthase F1 subunit delta [Moorellales bacterium]